MIIHCILPVVTREDNTHQSGDPKHMIKSGAPLTSIATNIRQSLSNLANVIWVALTKGPETTGNWVTWRRLNAVKSKTFHWILLKGYAMIFIPQFILNLLQFGTLRRRNFLIIFDTYRMKITKMDPKHGYMTKSWWLTYLLLQLMITISYNQAFDKHFPNHISHNISAVYDHVRWGFEVFIQC